MRKHYTSKDILLGMIFLLLIVGIVFVNNTAQLRQDPLYNTKIQAYEYMSIYMNVVKNFKEELGIEMEDQDVHNTGMIGPSYSSITTSLGSIEAKRTSANPHMASLAVELLHKAGVKSGDRIGANFSGSFPALNLAVLAASKAMDVECVFISSIGSSNYGANDPEITFPDMVIKLWELGLINNPGIAFSIGGSGDIGSEMEEEILSEIVERIEKSRLYQVIASDYQSNLKIRQQLFAKDGSITCFVNVGGNTTSLGKSESSYYFGQGLLTGKIVPITEKSGLIEIYRNQGIPVVHILNLKKLTADYGIPYDPMVLPVTEELDLYIKSSYNSFVAIIFVLIALIGLVLYRNQINKIES